MEILKNSELVIVELVTGKFNLENFHEIAINSTKIIIRPHKKFWLNCAKQSNAHAALRGCRIIIRKIGEICST